MRIVWQQGDDYYQHNAKQEDRGETMDTESVGRESWQSLYHSCSQATISPRNRLHSNGSCSTAAPGKHHPSGGGNPVAYSLEDGDTLGLNGL